MTRPIASVNISFAVAFFILAGIRETAVAQGECLAAKLCQGQAEQCNDTCSIDQTLTDKTRLQCYKRCTDHMNDCIKFKCGGTQSMPGIQHMNIEGNWVSGNGQYHYTLHQNGEVISSDGSFDHTTGRFASSNAFIIRWSINTADTTGTVEPSGSVIRWSNGTSWAKEN
jgi:hypothetical protein